MDALDKAKIETDLAQKKFVWKFYPPRALQFGGIWECVVQRCRKALTAILDKQSIADEVLCGTMCLVEQTLIARPVKAISDNPEDLTALTANNFSLG